MKEKIKSILIVLAIVALLLLVFIHRAKSSDFITDTSVMSYPQQSSEERTHITQCLQLHNVILHYLAESKSSTHNAIKADSYMKVYMEECDGSEQLMIDIINIENTWRLK